MKIKSAFASPNALRHAVTENFGNADDASRESLRNALGLAFSVMPPATRAQWRRQWRKHCKTIAEPQRGCSCLEKPIGSKTGAPVQTRSEKALTNMVVLLVDAVRETVSPVQKNAVMERWEHKLVKEGVLTLAEVFNAHEATRGLLERL